MSGCVSARGFRESRWVSDPSGAAGASSWGLCSAGVSAAGALGFSSCCGCVVVVVVVLLLLCCRSVVVFSSCGCGVVVLRSRWDVDGMGAVNRFETDKAQQQRTLLPVLLWVSCGESVCEVGSWGGYVCVCEGLVHGVCVCEGFGSWGVYWFPCGGLQVCVCVCQL